MDFTASACTKVTSCDDSRVRLRILCESFQRQHECTQKSSCPMMHASLDWAVTHSSSKARTCAHGCGLRCQKLTAILAVHLRQVCFRPKRDQSALWEREDCVIHRLSGVVHIVRSGQLLKCGRLVTKNFERLPEEVPDSRELDVGSSWQQPGQRIALMSTGMLATGFGRDPGNFSFFRAPLVFPSSFPQNSRNTSDAACGRARLSALRVNVCLCTAAPIECLYPAMTFRFKP